MVQPWEEDWSKASVTAGTRTPEPWEEDWSKPAAVTPPAGPTGFFGHLKTGLLNTASAAEIAATGNNPEKLAKIVAADAVRTPAQTEVQRKMQEEIAPYSKGASDAEGVVDNVTAWSKLAAVRLSQLVRNPSEAVGMIAENLPNSVPGLAGMVAGGAAGGTLGPAGAVIGGVVGGTAGGYAIEQGSAMKEQILKLAQERGVDPRDAAALEPIIREKYDEFLTASQKKGVGTAGTDAVLNMLTFGIAGMGERLIAKEARALTEGVKAGAISREAGEIQLKALVERDLARNTLQAKALRGSGVVGAEMLGEAASEAVGQKFAYGKVDPLEVVDEGLLAVGQGAGMAAGRKVLDPLLGREKDSAERAIDAARVVVSPKIVNAKDTDEAVEAFRFSLEGNKTGIDLAEIAKTYKDHTPEEIAANQARLLKAFENDINLGQAEDGTPTVNGARLRAIPAQELPTEGEGLTRDAYEAIATLNKALGKNTVVYEDDASLPDGFVFQPDVAFISNKTKIDPAVVAAHEVQHLSEQGEAQANYAKVVQEELTERAMARASERHEVEGPLSKARLMQEIRADIAGDAMADPTFHGRVIEKMREQFGDKVAEANATSLLDSIKQMIDRVKAVLTGTTYTTPDGKRLATEYVNNLERVHDALAAAIADNFIREGYRPPGAQTNTSQMLVSQALAMQAARVEAENTPWTERTLAQNKLLAAPPMVAPKGSSEALKAAIAAAQKAPFDRSTEERLNLEAVRLGVRMSPKQIEVGQSPANPEWERATYKGVTADYEASEKAGIAVFDITSTNRRGGEARALLQELKKKYGRVRAEGVVEDSPVAVAFWQKMLDEGIADSAVMTNGKKMSAERKASPKAGEAAVRLTPDEDKFFASFNDADMADLKEVAPSVRIEDGHLMVADADRPALEDYISELWGAAKKQYGGDGAKSLPKSFASAGDAFIRRLRSASDELKASPKKSDVGHKRTGTDGRYVGAPDWVGNSPQQLTALRAKLAQMANEGEAGRYWYEKSARAVLKFVGGDKEQAEKFVGLLALFSASNALSPNTTMALQAWYQWKAGVPIQAGRFPATQSKKAEAWLNRGEDYGGIKVNNFYQDLMEEIDPSKVDHTHSTMDMWMALAFDYGAKTLDQGPKYTFAQREVSALASKMGWKPHQVQAAIWTAMRARVMETEAKWKAREVALKIRERKDDGKPGEVIKGREYDHFRTVHRVALQHELTQAEVDANNADYATELAARTVQMSWEAEPGRTSGLLPGLRTATLEQKQEYLEAVIKALTDENGHDMVADLAGIAPGRAMRGLSAWEGVIGAGVQQMVPVHTEGAKADKKVAPIPRSALNRFAALRGYVLSQDAVVWHLPIYEDSAVRHNGTDILTERPLNAEEMATLYEAVHREFDTWDIAPGYTDAGARLLNFVDGLDNARFQKGMDQIILSLPEGFGGGVLRYAGFRSDGEYIANNWQENPNGEEYAERLRTGRPDIQERAADLRARVAAVNRDFSQRYGWGQAEPAGAGRAAVDGGRDGEGVRKSPKQQDALDIVGVHFSAQPREVVNGSFFGTGMKGAEIDRVMTSKDARLKSRVYAYVNTGQGVSPEKYVGGQPHVVQMPNLYDLDADQRGLYKPGDQSAFESAVLDAGFDGYFTRNLKQGVAVLIGPASSAVSAENKGSNYRGEDLPTPPAPQYTESRRAYDAFMADNSLPAGSMTGANWMKLVPGVTLNPDEVYYKDAVARKVAERGRMASPKSEAFRKWFGDSKVVDEKGEPLVVYHATSTDFNEFEPGGPDDNVSGAGIWLSRDPTYTPAAHNIGGFGGKFKDGTRVVPLYAKVENPLRITPENEMAMRAKYGSLLPVGLPVESLEKIINDGYDGIIYDKEVRFPEGIRTERGVIVFRANQVKSVFNEGDFNPASNDFLRSPKLPDNVIRTRATQNASNSHSGDPSPAEAKRVEAALTGKTPIQAAKWLMETGDDVQKLVAERVLVQLEKLKAAGVKQELKIAHVGDTVPRSLLGARGAMAWDLVNDRRMTVWLNGADVAGKVGVEPSILLHELVHMAVNGALQLGNQQKYAGMPAGERVIDITNVYKAVVKHFNDRARNPGQLTDFEKKIYQRANNAIDNAYELVAWALSDREAQAYLETIPYKGHSSAWTAFVSAVRALLGIPVRANTALSEILRVSENLMAADISGMIIGKGESAQVSRGAREDLFLDEFADESATVTDTYIVSTRGMTEDRVKGNVNSNGTKIAATKQGLRKFWNWFGESEIVDDTGRPVVLYHSTKGDFSVFETMRESTNLGMLGTPFTTRRSGIFLTPNAQFAEEYSRAKTGANTMPLYVRMENPLDLRKGLREFVESELSAAGYNTRMFQQVQYDWELFEEEYGGPDLVRALKEAGYDGAIINEEDDNRETQTTYVAFESNQIKSVFNENPTSNPDILKSPKIASAERMLQSKGFDILTTQELQEYNAGRFSEGGYLPGVEESALGWREDGSVLRKDFYVKDPGGADLGSLRTAWYYPEGVAGGADTPEMVVTDAEGREIASRKASPKITGASRRQYTPAQQKMFENVGRTVDEKSFVDKVKELRKDLGKKLAQGLVDQFAPLKELSPMAYMLARLSKGTAGAVEALLRHGKLKLVGSVYDADQSGGFVETVAQPLQGEVEDFLWWVAANRAEQLKAEDRERLFSKSDIAAGKTLADGKTTFDYTLRNGTVTRDRKLIFADTLAKFDAFNKNVMDIAEQSGLIDGASRPEWERQFYVPFYRIGEEQGTFIGGKSPMSLVRQTAFKRLKGGEAKLNSDLLANTLKNWTHLIDASAKNRAAQSAIEAAVNTGIAVEADAATVKSMANSLNKKSATVWFRDNGVQRHFFVDDPFVMTAISSLEYAGMRNGVMDAMSAFKHILTVGVTASPAFKVKNLIRDSLQAVATSPISFNVVNNVKEGIAASDPQSQTYVSALASGGLIRFGTMLEGRQSDRVRQLVRQTYKDSSIINSDSKLRAVYDKFIDPAVAAYNELGNRSEEINRASLYKQLIKQGMAHGEAALLARDLMDFSLQGSWTGIRFLTQVVPFMNARMQGLYKLGRAAQEDPRRFASVVAATAMFSIALMAAYSDDDDWKKREDWDRDNYWWFKIAGHKFVIPKPFEIGSLATLAERGVEYFTSKEMTGERFRTRVMAMLSDTLAMNPVPQMVKPLLSVYANKDSFSGRPIETMGMERLQPDYRYTSRSSMLARGLSTAGQAVTSTVGANFVSPVQIDSMLRGYFGWLGTFVVGASDMAVRPLTNEPTRPSMDVIKFVTQDMVAELPADQSRYVSHMYEQAQQIERAWGTYQSLVKTGKREEAKEFLEDNRDKLIKYKAIERVKSTEAKLNERIRMIERSTKTPDEKREMIRAVNEQKDKIARLVY